MFTRGQQVGGYTRLRKPPVVRSRWTMGHERVILLHFLGYSSEQIAEMCKNGPALVADNAQNLAGLQRTMDARGVRRVCASAQGQHRLKLLQEELEKRTIDTHTLVAQYYQMLAPEAIQVLAQTMRDPGADRKERRQAATEILHGAGHRPVAHSVVEKITGEVHNKYAGKSETEIRAMLKAELQADRTAAQAPPPPKADDADPTVH